MLATTKIGMWKRNGAPVEGQFYIYNSPHLGPYQKKHDLLFLQVRLKFRNRVFQKLNVSNGTVLPN
jgi:hypothetical protein